VSETDETALLKTLAEQHHKAVIDFCQRLVQTPSPSGDEGAAAELVRQEMVTLGYDEVWIDGVGNVIGLMRGGKGPSVMLNCHLDQVDPGDEQQWPFPPYSGTIHDGCIWGRGASDTKGALAPQVYAPAALRQAGLPLPGDVVVTGVVQEEVNGLGTWFLLKELRTDLAVLGEATSNQLNRGHRGRGEFIARIHGRAAHASAPDRGVNPHTTAARFLLELGRVPLGNHPELGPATLAPTLYAVDQTSANVIPGQLDVHLDWRFVPGDRPEEMQAALQALLDECCLPGSHGEVILRERHLVSYTGYRRLAPSLTLSFLLPREEPLVQEGHDILARALGKDIRVGEWGFGTDGGMMVEAGIPTIGFSPCEEDLAHTSEDRVSIALMMESLIGYMALALHLGERLEKTR
jgi:putative selenium metabolism hydrolase